MIRPFTLLAPLIVSTSIMISSYFYHQTENVSNIYFSIILPASLCFALLNGASNTLNQATDKDADCISKPYRPIPSGQITQKEALCISVILYALVFMFAMMVHLMFFSLIVVIAVFTITYSLPPRLKDFLLLNQLWIAIPRGFLGIVASWSVFGSIFEPLPLVIGFVAGLFLFGGSITKDITDSVADSVIGTKTLINTYGIKKAALFSLPFLFFPFLLISVFIILSYIEPSFWILTFFSLPGIYIFYLLMVNDKKNRRFENTSAWTMMYVTYFFFSSCFSGITIINSIY